MAKYPTTFLELLLLKDKNGEPWVPSWRLTLVALPLITVVDFILREVSFFSGLTSPSTGSKGLSDIDWGQFPMGAAWFLGFHYIFILPIFYIKRSYWRKHHRQGQGADNADSSTAENEV